VGKVTGSHNAQKAHFDYLNSLHSQLPLNSLLTHKPRRQSELLDKKLSKLLSKLLLHSKVGVLWGVFSMER
jgi:hypothetical protein